MKVLFKIATGLALTVAALACGSAARAGEGGAAGSVSIRFGSATSGAPFVGAPPAVDRLSSSVAVGKNFAAATALTETGAPTTTPVVFSPQTRTAAIGAAGTATLNDANASGAAYTYTAENNTDRAINQINAFGGGGAASLAPITGVTLP
jgi:hypothetical protein